MQQALQTLKYWFDVEALTTPNAEEDNDRGADHFVTYVRDATLPWEPRFRQPQRPHKHFVRFGIVPRTSYEQELLTALETASAPDYDSGGQKDKKAYTFLGVFEVDAKGYAQVGTLQMSAFAVAFSRLKNSGQLEFRTYHETLTEYFDKEAQRLAAEPISVDGAFIDRLAGKAISLLNWTPAGMKDGPSVIVVSKAVIGEDRRARNPQIDPVNGFFLEEIDAVISGIRNKEPTGLVVPYLAEPSDSGRIDCTKIESIDAKLSLDLLPDGRWPAQFPLTLMQQVAVNEGLRTLRPGGMFSLNGPPGTGKTTLLMDVVAAVIVERAKILASYSNPRDAFERRWQVQYQGKKPANVYALDGRLHDFTMVVASANNGAVENVTREFPNGTKVAPRYRDRANYFSPTATALLNTVTEGDDDDAVEEQDEVKAWGLISAVLGKMANRTSFANVLNAKTSDGARSPANIFRQLDEEAGTVDWSTARREFTDSLALVSRLKDAIANFESVSSSLPDLRKAAAYWAEELKTRHEAAEVAKAAGMAAASALADCEEEFRSADKGADLRRPGGVMYILALLPSTLKISRSARNRIALFEAAIEHRTQCEAARNSARTAARQSEQLLKAKAGAVSEAQQKHESAKQSLATQNTQLETLRGKLTGLVSFNDLTSASEHDRQQMLPRMCDALNDARAMVFVKAMALHRAFVFGAGNAFSGNLKRALGMLTGDRNLAPIINAAGRDLWTTLSLLVPVVSTTFASFARCFAHMPRGGIGWLFVDEAGQAVPQHAVGALARAKRALIVGDPLQVEPVITLDKNVDAKLLERHGARVRHQSTATSLQVIADQNNKFGTYLDSHTGERVWVGSPLKVHRRCVEPMFSISNKIAYNKTMVLGRGKSEEEVRLTEGDAKNARAPSPLFGPSSWIDVQGTEGCEKHYIPAQADIALGLVKTYLANGWVNEKTGMPNLFVISPFKTAASGMRTDLKRTRREWASHIPTKEFDKWVKRSVGTVHTFQGKEAESVIFLLGGSTFNAVRWAASTPNIFNVGVTRAQRRLYVVGDWNEWMKCPLVKGTMNIEGWRVSRDVALDRINSSLKTIA
ncbi:MULTISPECIES: ATP-binding protein [unclassified Ensifer]|uniref:DEAD/DEAH box helicase n=1 Tax=unclassified Ensifer TaxID=2633371 RepID=UPI000812FC87|nr:MULTISPECIES: ATP-binding protein [unclassified Ensifer]OCP02324.1 hypothetical protein BC362_18825 [Ensifer sp. LC14]OCP14191.1 hypothetical protein BC374_00460 [Ensifer sp. LC13]OCP14867.1 hypothetical protein BBX50_00810 [Ensifer sp. LC11]OCP34354.1 hypothetical protein BC364_00460 [Ensifer sp. LC499]